jgi:tetratricopeptide (TPR) repeat protein
LPVNRQLEGAMALEECSGQILLERLGLPRADGAAGIDATLRDVVIDGFLVEDFRPLASCLEWELCRLAWERDGPRLFVRHDVPNLVNNSGRASDDAAEVFLAHCLDQPTEGPLDVLELGAGLGLFALLFLDSVRDRCREAGRDEYDRLIYHVTDGTPAMVRHWSALGMFDRHTDKVRPTLANAIDPGTVKPVGPRFRAVLLNYVLDVLPATIVRLAPEGPQEFRVRTYLPDDRKRLNGSTADWTIEKVRALADSGEHAALASLLDSFEFEARFVPVRAGDLVPRLEQALAFGPELQRVLLNHAALDCLDACVRLTAPDGFVLVNDYGPVSAEEVAEYAMAQRFGPSAAVGVNFPLLDWYAAVNGWAALRPDPPSERRIHTRLFAAAANEWHRTRAGVADRYGRDGARSRDEPAVRAREHTLAKRPEDALASFRIAVQHNPRDWQVLGHAAEFVGLTVKDFDAGATLARAALERNPWFSPWLWNVLGDCLFCLDRYDDAHKAFLEARRINPDDARTLYNLSYTLPRLGRHAEALESLAAALARDTGDEFRERLLTRQRQVLELMDAHRAQSAASASRRVRSFLG